MNNYFQETVAGGSGVPFLTILVVLPLVVAALIWIFKPLRVAGKQIALIASLLELAVALVGAFMDFKPAAAAQFQLGEIYTWIPSLGVSWALGVNGIALVMVILAIALTPLSLLADWKVQKSVDREAGYAALIMVLLSFMVLVFAARDLLLFYIAFEGMLIPLYFLIGRFGEEGIRRHAAIKFVLYSLAGGLIMLVGVIYVWVTSSGPQRMLLDHLTSAHAVAAYGNNIWLFLTFFAAFAIKAPMVPVHTWLPTTAEAARPGTSALLVGILDKVGTFGMLTFCWSMFPEASKAAAPAIIIGAVVSILYGALAALWQKNLLRLVSFTSISHFGFMVMGLYVGSNTAITGALLYMVAHGVSIAALFFLSGWLIERGGSPLLENYGGWQRVTPLLAGLFLISGLAAIALPGLSGFLPEYLVLVGTFQVLPWAAVLGVIGVVFAAVYILLPYQKMFTGPVPKQKEQVKDLGWTEKLVMIPLVAAMLGLGFYPGPTMDVLSPIATQLTASDVVAAGEGGAQ